MAYIVLSVIGVLAVLLVSQSWKQKSQAIFILAALGIGLAVYLAVDRFVLAPRDVVVKGSWTQQIPWWDIGLYFMMVVGMAAKYFFDAIGTGNQIDFQKWQFIKPVFISPIIFGVIYGKAGEGTALSLLLIFAFQNGFFWQTVLTKTSAPSVNPAAGK
jgi:hypothetical protein